MTNDIIDLMSQDTFDGRDVLEAFIVAGMFHVKQCKKFRLWQPENDDRPTLLPNNTLEVAPEIIFMQKLTKLFIEAEEIILQEYQGTERLAGLQEKVREMNDEYEPRKDDLETLEVVYNFFKEAYGLEDGFTYKALQDDVENQCHFVDDRAIRDEAKEKAYEFGFVKEGSPIENCIDWDEWAEQYQSDMQEIEHPFKEGRTLYFN